MVNATEPDFRKYDAGSSFRVTCRKYDNSLLDLTDAEVMKIIFKPKDSEAIIKDAVIPSELTGADGVLEYVFVAGDLAHVGDWQAQAYVYYSTTKYYYSTQVKFKVGDVLAQVPTE